MEIDLQTVHTDIRDGTARHDNLLAKLKGRGNTNRLDRGINTALASHIHDRFHGVAVGVVDDGRGTKTLGHFKAIVVEIDHDDLSGREKLRGKKRGHPDRSRANDCYNTARFDFAVKYTTLESGRQNIAKHH